MRVALYDPAGGYYQRWDLERWGREGDYRTSPERSELFAAAFARYFAKLYDELQKPEEWSIVECGAGDGRFALGVLRALANRFPQVFAATRYVVYELSDDARRRARERLAEFDARVEFYSEFELVSAQHGIYFSNELLDAFPVHRVVKNRDGLAELYVTLDADGGFAWSTGPLSTERLADFYSELADGQIIEINLAIDDWLTQVAAKLDEGFLITVDYGEEARELYDPARRPHGSLRGFSRHGFVDDVLAQPGECDLTTTINWTQVKSTGERLGFEVVEFASQDRFLLNAELLEELELMIEDAHTDAEKVALSTNAREMILPGGMASSFQVLVHKKHKR
ncbi:MAG TPA: class I SAM-dependent methyltransferase [Pyrinomonadaceae bacterium]|nr:class I SAM-dependent methyltransferase [Pyrinomonadaceae bacterium]